MKQFNFFAEAEQRTQARFQQTRDSWLAPVVHALAWAGVSPNLVSLAGMLALAPFVGLVLAYPEPWMVSWWCVFLLLHVLLDGLDGPLARHYSAESRAGAFVDMCCDHGGMVVVAWTLSAAGLIDGTIGNVYVFLYTTAVVFIVWLNALGRPFGMVFRSKYFFYALIFVDAVSGGSTLNPALVVFSIAHGWLCLLGFVRVHRLLAEDG